ncbi:MAG: glycosyl hydrolase family 18 protein [Candidatus Acidiferrales bacterium]
MPRTLAPVLRCLLPAALLLAGSAPGASCRETPPVAQFYYVNELSPPESLRSRAAHMSLLSPQWLIVVEEGKLASMVDAGLVRWARESGVPLMPLLLNFEFKPEIAHEVLTTDSVQRELIERVLGVAREHNFYGIQLDFENVPIEDRQRFGDFVRRLGKALRQRGMKLSVAVPAPLASAPLPGARSAGDWPQNEHSLAFDYRRLGKEADFLTLMAYDQHTEPDAPGPVAGLPWVEASLRWVLKSVSRKKLHLGLPLYYRKWGGEKVSEGTYAEALAIAEGTGASPQLDTVQMERTLEFDEDGTRAVLWYQDAETLQRRMELVRRYKLRGFSAWRLGHEDPAAWQRAFPAGAQRLR